jgi:hypothetical protein
MEELGYVYGFTASDLHALKPMQMYRRLHSIRLEGECQFEQMVQEMAQIKSEQRPPYEIRTVKIYVFDVDTLSEKSLEQLHGMFPECQQFYIANHAAHQLFKHEFKSLGSFPMHLLKEVPRKKLSMEFFAFVLPTNRHLWADSQQPSEND